MALAGVDQRADHRVRRAAAGEAAVQLRLPGVERRAARRGRRRAARAVDDLVGGADVPVQRVRGRPHVGGQAARGPVVRRVVPQLQPPAGRVRRADPRVHGSHCHPCRPRWKHSCATGGCSTSPARAASARPRWPPRSVWRPPPRAAGRSSARSPSRTACRARSSARASSRRPRSSWPRTCGRSRSTPSGRSRSGWRGRSAAPGCACSRARRRSSTSWPPRPAPRS